MMDHLIRFVQAHESFREPEIEALSKLASLKVDTVSYSSISPFCIIHFSCKQDLDLAASKFISRSILSRGIYELWGTGSTYEDLHTDVKKRSSNLWEVYRHASFKFSIDAYCGKRTSSEQRDIINSFRYLGFEGKIDLVKPQVEFVVFEEFEVPQPSDQHGNGDGVDTSTGNVPVITRTPKRLFLGRRIAPSIRYLADKHDLKRRPYISTTSMDAELALVTANLALAGAGKLFYDPFVGTGGFLVAAAELNAMVLGSDIDGRSFRGKGQGIEKGVGANITKYGLKDMFGDCIISDLTNTPLRVARQGMNHSCNGTGAGRWLDGIICDPPYGVREGLKVLGRRIENGAPESHLEPYMIDGVPAFTLKGYVAPKKPYSFVRMLYDILDFASRTLVDGGRIAFWMPTANDEEEIEIPKHHCLQLLHCCVQPFNKWSRRLLVYVRTTGDESENEHDGREQLRTNGTSADELNPFRRKYFRGFDTT